MAEYSLSRRKLLKLGLGASLLLSGAGLLAQCSSTSGTHLAQGMQTLRHADLDFLARVIPVILQDAIEPNSASIHRILQGIDYSLSHLAPAALEQAQQLFSVASSDLTRGIATGVWGPWAQASDQQVLQFLQRWRDSSLALLQQGYYALLQMVQMSHYSQPAGWVHCGYPGPPQV